MITAVEKSNFTVNLTGKQGTSWNIIVSCFSDTAKTIPLNISAYNARGQYRANYGSAVLINFECTVLPYHATTNINESKIYIHVDASVSTACLVYSGVYDVELYTADDESVERAVEGLLVISREVTHAG